MALVRSSTNSFWADRSLVGFRIELRRLTERDSSVFFKNLRLDEVIGGRESEKLVCNSYLLWV